MTDSPTDQPARRPRRVYSRPPIDGTEEEFDAWVDAFVTSLDWVRNEPTASSDGP